MFTVIERCLWKSFYTPLCCLMIPYAFVVLCTVVIAQNEEVVDFCYPSLKVWIIGLAIFAIPSWIINILFVRKHLNESISFPQEWFDIPKGINALSLILGLAFLGHLYFAYRSSPYALGTDDFALYVCGSGLWAHVREASTPLLILLLYLKNRTYKRVFLNFKTIHS